MENFQMSYLTPTPNILATTSLITLILGSFFIANQIHENYLRNFFGISLIESNLIIKFLFVIYSYFIFPINFFSYAPIKTQLIAFLLSPLITYLCIKIETYFILHINLKKFHLFEKNENNSHFFPSLHSYRYAIVSIFLVGAFEEILYRGYLSILCLNHFNFITSTLLLIFITFLFALNHLSLGFIHVVTKFVLGTLCLASFLLTQTIILPMLIHGLFNALVLHKQKEFFYVK